jgi:hypothetical protein
MSSITVSSLVLGSLTVEVDGSDSTLALSVLGTAPATLSIELGTPGATGTAATIAVGTTTTLSPGSPATVTNVGTSSAATFNFGIPQGIAGPTGATGAGVPAGGTDGQILAKIDAVDYNTQWATAFALQVRNQVRNETGATLTKGAVVYVTGASGNKVTVSKALATGDATSAQTFAVLLENIPNNQNGYAVTSGLLENLDTSAYAAGTQVYLSPTTAGTFTPTKPSAPDHLVYVGVIERSHVNQGTMLVRIQNGYELEELHNVAIASLANNDLLAYDSATDLWKNKTFGTLGLLTSSTAASTYAPLASPALTGVPTAPTATAGTNTTQLATTAFVTAAVPAFATVAETRSGTSTTTSIHPRDLAWSRQSNSNRSLTPSVGQFTSTTTGAGAGGQVGIFQRQSYNTGVGTHNYSTRVGGSSFNMGLYVGTGGSSNNSQLNYSGLIWISARWYLDMATANNTVRTKFGHGYGSSVTGDLSTRGFGVKVSNRGGALVLCHHNGTTYTETTSSFTPAQYQVFDWDIISQSGTVTLFVNGSSVASSSTSVPSGLASGDFGWQSENVTVTSNTYTSVLNEFAGNIFATA